MNEAKIVAKERQKTIIRKDSRLTAAGVWILVGIVAYDKFSPYIQELINVVR